MSLKDFNFPDGFYKCSWAKPNGKIVGPFYNARAHGRWFTGTLDLGEQATGLLNGWVKPKSPGSYPETAERVGGLRPAHADAAMGLIQEDRDESAKRPQPVTVSKDVFTLLKNLEWLPPEEAKELRAVLVDLHKENAGLTRRLEISHKREVDLHAKLVKLNTQLDARRSAQTAAGKAPAPWQNPEPAPNYLAFMKNYTSVGILTPDSTARVIRNNAIGDLDKRVAVLEAAAAKGTA